MKWHKAISRVWILVFLLGACNNPYKSTKNSETDYYITPKPAQIDMTEGRFLVNGKTLVQGPESLANEGIFLASMLSTASGHGLEYGNETQEGGSHVITLRLDETIGHDEGYRLQVAYDGITISGKTPTGVFYGIQTLGQLLPIQSTDTGSKEITIPAVSIEDYPRFTYRGMMLDVARNFFPKKFIKQFIDLMAMHKMNRFHWHLTEDQGWRIEIKKYPKLTEVGAYRNGTIVGHHPGTANDNKRYGGFYTQDDIKEIVAYATSRHIEVIPEIELPGHSQAAIASYPELSCFPNEPTKVFNDMISDASRKLQSGGTPKIVQETWGVQHDVYCAGKEFTFEFLQGVLDEVIPLFPSNYIHIGGDECPKDSWERCPNCQKRIKDEGLRDEHELQSYFVRRMEKYLNEKGKRIIGWDEILEGGLAPNATVMSWRGTKGGVEAAKQGHDVIMTPTSHCYFDYYQSEDKEHEPLAIGGYLPVQTVYAYEPMPSELTEDEQQFVLGAQGNVWTEYINTPDNVNYMTLPRMTALSEVVWSPKEAKDWDNFKKRLRPMVHRYETMGMRVAKHAIKE